MSEFVFQWPTALALLLCTLPLVWLLAHARKQRLKLIEAMGGGHPTHRKLRDVFRTAAFILLVLALARPGYAPETEATSRSGRDVVFAIDVSQSMLAEDAMPSRLEVAKQGVRDALQTFGNERVGLIVYAGSSSILCPLTYDYDFVRYMLEQANTRTVDFGGTTLQSAVEKAVDQVFMDGRKDVQDLIVMTDGGDHGSIIAKTVELLNEKGVDTLLLGLGDPHQGSPIKLKDDEGAIKLLEYEGSPVYTKLDDAALREFAAQSNRVDYLPIGTAAFNLGQIYIEYAQDKQVDSTDSENGIIIYKEAAIFFLIPALILLLLSERWGAHGAKLAHVCVFLSCFTLLPEIDASESFEENFLQATTTLEAGAYEDANALFNEIHQSSTDRQANPEQLGAIQFNRGLALIGQASQQDSLQLSLGFVQQAQLAFLAAKRSDPTLQRAGVRLQLTANQISDLELQIAEMEAESDLMNKEMEALITRLQALLIAQTELRTKIKESATKANASQQIKAFSKIQTTLLTEAKELQKVMEKLDQMMQVEVDGGSPQDSIMAEPLNLIGLAQVAQTSAHSYLGQVENWSLSQELQTEAEQHIERILELLASDSQQEPSDDQDYDEMDEDYDYMDDDQEGMSSSDAMEGDFAAASEMQELPVPNYSAEDILMEEQGSQQFRQQKRASANAAKVEKDF
ncbi:MAG: vWA domain-containing protein [Opitutaceae bacterium]